MDEQAEIGSEMQAVCKAETEKARRLVSAILHPDRGSLRIVVIDDEPVLLELILEMLQAMGHSAIAFSTAEAALTELAVSSYDIIFTDVRMPGISGQEFYYCLKASDADQAAKVIFLTGDTAAMQTRRFLKESGRRWLSKPFTYAALAKCLESVTQSKKHNLAA